VSLCPNDTQKQVALEKSLGVLEAMCVLSAVARGAKSRIIMADREWVPRSPLLAQWSEELIYPFRPKMAKVEH
jgi:hypothetical protein